MANTNLVAARAAKNDEFYTQYHDVEAEMNAYLDYDVDTFRDKTVLLPCDDPEWSSFTRYFAARFRDLAPKRLISTSYAPGSKRYRGPWQPTIFETRSPRFRPARSQLQGKIFTLDRYDNYDAIEVPYVDAIPSDYDGVMGVPITFLDRYCPEQFEILGASESEGSGFSNGLWRAESGVAQPMVDARRVYKRIFIRRRSEE